MRRRLEALAWLAFAFLSACGQSRGPLLHEISGSVSGSGAGGVALALGGDGTGSTVTVEAGRFTFHGLADGHYTLTPQKSGYTFSPAMRTVALAGADVAGQDFAATAVPARFEVSGMVSGALVANVTVELSGASTSSATTAQDGRYLFAGVAPGTYTLVPHAQGFLFAPPSLVVTVSASDVPGQDFVSAPLTFDVSGSVRGDAAGGVTVSLGGAASGSTVTDPGGNYRFRGLRAGSYTLTPSKLGNVFAPASLAVTVSGADVGQQDFTSTALLHDISGTIRGAASAGLKVTLGGAALRSTTTDAAGRYSFVGLPVGSYAVTPSDPAYVFSPASLAVTLGDADVAGQDFASAAKTCPLTHSHLRRDRRRRPGGRDRPARRRRRSSDHDR
ncbi:MAG: carboxypeptidase regulatory-like domain-containing protein [Myxococcales bacterium]